MFSKNLKILLIEDSAGDARLVMEYLRNDKYDKLELTHVDNLSSGINILRKEKFDAILLDLLLPESEGLETFFKIKENAVDTPIIVMTGFGDESMSLKAIQQGAEDYLIKGVADEKRIQSAIHFAIERNKRRKEEKKELLHKKLKQIMVVSSYKGGTGKSLTALNLAYTLSKVFNMKTLLIDAAGFSNHITTLLKKKSYWSLSDLQNTKDFNNLFLNGSILKYNENLSVISGPILPDDVCKINIDNLNNLIEAASDTYRFIVVDTKSGTLNELNKFLLQKADEIILLTTYDLLTFKDTEQYIQALKQINIPENKIKLTMNRSDWDRGSLDLSAIYKKLSLPIYFDLPNSWELCVESINSGIPIIDIAPYSNLSMAFKTFAANLIDYDIPKEHIIPAGYADSKQYKHSRHQHLNETAKHIHKF